MDLADIIGLQAELYLKPGDNILFILDEPFWDTPLLKVVTQYNNEVVRIPEVNQPGFDYQLREDQMSSKTVAWLITSRSITYAPTTREMKKRGIWVISNPGITPDWIPLLSRSRQADCQQNANRLIQKMGGDVGGKIQIWDRDGTDLRLWVPAQNWKQEVGLRSGSMTCGVFGELSNVPFDANGVLILNPGDFLTNPINELKGPVVLRIQSNRVTSISGEGQSDQLRSTLEAANNELAFNLGEFSFGLNPALPEKILRSVVAEKLAGGIHIAMGTPLSVNPRSPDFDQFRQTGYNAGVHIDAIKFDASVSLHRYDPDQDIELLKSGQPV